LEPKFPSAFKVRLPSTGRRKEGPGNLSTKEEGKKKGTANGAMFHNQV